MDKKPIIVIAILCVIALGLGYVYGKWRQGSGQGNTGNAKGKEETTSEEPEFLKQGLVAYYPFDGNASDMSGNGNHGTVSGVTFGADQKGSPNKAGNFNGIDDEVNLGNGANLNPADGLSISAWVNATSIGTWMSVVERYTAQDGKQCYLLSIRDNGPAVFTVFHGGSSTNNTSVRTQESLQPKKWYFLVGTYHKNDGAHIFVDGSSKAFTQGNQTIQQKMENTTISGYLNSTHKFFKGSIDNVRIYNRALSAAEVKALYDFEKVKE